MELTTKEKYILLCLLKIESNEEMYSNYDVCYDNTSTSIIDLITLIHKLETE
jgi:hypothetical protein